jgi:filamentous hemagglutinin
VWVHNAACCDVLNQNPINPSMSGYLSKNKLGREAIELDAPTANQRLMINDVVANGDRFGVKTEVLVNDVLYADPAVKVLSGTKYGGNNGLDHVVQFTDPQSGKLMTMVIDSKQLAKSGSSKLDPNAAGGVMQLSTKSLETIVGRLNNSPAAVELDKAIKNGTLVKAVAFIDKLTGQLKIVPVKVP